MRGLSAAQWAVLEFGVLRADSVAAIEDAAGVLSADELRDLILRAYAVPPELLFRVHAAVRAKGVV